MRTVLLIIYPVLIMALAACAVIAHISRKPNGNAVCLLLSALGLPLLGNLLVLASAKEGAAGVGYYVYLLGMDLAMYALLRFTREFCHMARPLPVLRLAVCAVLILDGIQILCNVSFGHAFSLEERIAGNFPYFLMVPGPGLTVHRLVDYLFLAAVLLILFAEMFRASQVNTRRYLTILAAMAGCAVWEVVNVLSGTVLDSSLMGLGFFGILTYYLALYYRPARLMDRMLAAIAAELPEALFFFDSDDRCIWVNEAGTRLAGVKEESFDQASRWLTDTFSPPEKTGEGWTAQRILGEGEETRCFVLEKHILTDTRGREAGSFLRVRDNTDEQRTLQKEIYNATHDSLTGVYNRAGYNLILADLNMANTFMLMLDGDGFKGVNDVYGHGVGDRILQKIADRVKSNFRPEDYVCRVGGDEFVVLVIHAGEQMEELIGSRIERINAELRDASDGLPPVTISVGIAHGSHAENFADLFERADKALYETKSKGKASYTFYHPET